MGVGYRKLPLEIIAEIESLDGRPFVFGASRKQSDEVFAQWVTELGLLEEGSASWRGLPPASAGRWSKWNLSGRKIVRRDLPKISRSWSIEAPNFNGNGTHTVTFTRDAYQRTWKWGEELEANVALVDEPTPAILGIVQKELVGPVTEENKDDLLYAASLARTWFGAAHIFPIGEDGVPELPNQQLGWEILPDGTHEEIRDALVKHLGRRAGSSDIDIMIDRLQKVASLKPEKRLVGSNGMQNYIGYQFGDEFVAFENPRLGNALYLMYGDWESLSKRSRTELLSGRHGSDFDRIIHTARWFDRLRMAVYDYRRHRD